MYQIQNFEKRGKNWFVWRIKKSSTFGGTNKSIKIWNWTTTKQVCKQIGNRLIISKSLFKIKWIGRKQNQPG